MFYRFLCAVLLFGGQAIFGQADAINIGTLPNEISETSGLIFYNNALITHNDSGNSPQLFEIDTTSLAITRTVTIENATNVDWEDLAQDDNYIYIGDFGNNLGQREDLAIYRILKADYVNSDSVTADVIQFSYEDQTDFSGNQNSDWDAEAFLVLGDQLVIFTKQWQSNGTVAYGLPKSPGTHTALNLGSFSSDGLVTGATYNELSGVLFLIGYSQQLQPFVLRIDGLTDSFSFNGMEQKNSLAIGFSQVEGITYVDENTYYFTSERFVNNNPPISLEAGLFRFKTEDSMPGEEDPEDPPPGEEIPEEAGAENEELIIFFNSDSEELQYELNIARELYGRAIFDVTGRRITHTHANEITDSSIDLSIFRNGVYYLTFYLQGKTISKPFIHY